MRPHSASRIRPQRPDDNPRLSDGVVTLRLPDEGDLAAIELGIHDPDVVRWIGPSEAGAVDVLELNRKRWAEGSPTFSICEMDGLCVGHIWINVRADDRRVGSVGYWLLPIARGRGLATRAVRLISAWAVATLGIKRLLLTTEPANSPSQRVAMRSGFRQVDVLRNHGEINGRPIDRVVFELPIDDVLEA